MRPELVWTNPSPPSRSVGPEVLPALAFMPLWLMTGWWLAVLWAATPR